MAIEPFSYTRCGNGSTEVNYSLATDSWLCLDCYTRATVSRWRRWWRRIGWKLGVWR